MSEPAPPMQQRARSASSIGIDQVSRRFAADAVALDDVSLDIQPGEFFTLLGPSGCGKTTLLRLLAGLDQPDSGLIHIGGRSMQGVPPHRRSVNTVFQSYALFPHRNVRENVRFGLEMQRLSAAEISRRIERTAALIGIDQLLERGIDQLSGGQRQRVALARALVNEPDVLLLDEPLSALDAGLRGRLQVELRRLQRQLGMTFVFVTHDQEEAMVMSDRIAVLNHGRLAQIGTPQAIYEKPADEFVARFMGHENLLPIKKSDATGIETPIGRFSGDFTEGAYLLLPPQSLILHRLDQPAAPDCIEAVVDECLYRGGMTEYRLSCSGWPLVATLANQGRPGPTAGDRVRLEVVTRAAAVLQAEGDG